MEAGKNGSMAMLLEKPRVMKCRSLKRECPFERNRRFGVAKMVADLVLRYDIVKKA